MTNFYEPRPMSDNHLLLHTDVLLLALKPRTDTLEYAMSMFALPTVQMFPTEVMDEIFQFIHGNKLNVVKAMQGVDEITFALTLQNTATVRKLVGLDLVRSHFPLSIVLNTITDEETEFTYLCSFYIVNRKDFEALQMQDTNANVLG